MPIYEYECQQCHRHTEKRQKFSDPEITQCPHCGGPLQRVLSAPAFSFAGGGWYKDLYSSNKPAPSGGESKGEGGGTGKAEGSNDGKPASGSTDSKPASGGDSKGAAPAPAAAPASTSSSSDKK